MTQLAARLGPLLLSAACAQAAAGVAVPVATDPALESRVNLLGAELRCLVCQNQSLADSHAELAIDLKNQIREQLRAGRSEQQVIDYMTERYGDFVRYRPPLKPTTVLLWSGPAFFVLFGLIALWRSLGRSPAEQEPRALSVADEERALELLGDPRTDTSASSHR